MQMFDLFHIYQIGDVVIDFSVNNAMANSSAFSASSKRLLFTNRFSFGKPTLSSPKSFTISGTLISRSFYTENQLFSRLELMGGKVVDVIAYLNLDECNVYGLTRDVYQNGLLWFTSRAFISNVSSQPGDVNTISITLTMTDYWEVLNRIKWDYRISGYPYNYSLEYADFAADPFEYISPFVMVDFAVNYPTHGYRWYPRRIANGTYSWSADYQPTLMQHAVSEVRMGFPTIGAFGTTSAGGSHSVYCDDTLYNAPAKSIYWLNLTAGVYQPVYLTYTNFEQDLIGSMILDLSELDTALADAGYTGIQDGDVLYFGDTHVKPGFIIRGNVLLSDVFPPMIYDDEFVGKIYPGMNQVHYNNPDYLVLNYYHHFRRL